MNRIDRDIKETYKKLLDKYDLEVDNVGVHTDLNHRRYNVSNDKMSKSNTAWHTPFIEDKEDDKEMSINNLYIGDLSLYNNSGNDTLDLDTIKLALETKVYTEDEDYPLYYFFLDSIEELPLINNSSSKKVADLFYNEYKAFCTEERSIYVNIKAEWTKITFNQFKNSLEKFLMTSLKEELVKDVIRQIHMNAIKDNFI